MIFEETHIAGLIIIKPRVFEDSRGFFFESYNKESYAKLGLKVEFIQDNLSKSQKGVVRGLHFQKPPFEQGKLVQVIRGSVIDVAVDIRKNSKTYGQYIAIELSEQNKTQFYIPPGFAHGFSTLEDNTIFSYKCTNVYNKESEDSIFWNDDTLKIDWGVKNPIISEKDKLAKPFDQFKSPF
ncbi:MAG: dTDP-4-dehydrorhamnose 3,5-epimerase [Bacteroidetes bacterium]|nr:MAG: dTDP-4-dehydrorhamnose 3,5-epimerase [Bacteroidota bacterium]MBL1145857.1 dTDP-4-dehydrorhamnose 3,5-epimerase [Bacteroidota bacterium]NOG58651.1 dTDP-4-dehydrorhamnose 3,5-epimerase [Bacteroidota bacterium]